MFHSDHNRILFFFILSLSIYTFFSSILCNSRRTLFEVCMPFTLCTHLKCKIVYKARDATVYWPTCCILWAMYKYCCARLRGCCHRFNIVCMPSYIYIRFLLHSLDIRFGVFYCLFFTFWCFPGYMGVCVCVSPSKPSFWANFRWYAISFSC